MTDDDDDDDETIFHYTSEAGVAGILQCQCILQSTGGTNARYGDGAYFTNLSPLSTVGTTSGQLSYALINVPWNTAKVSHFVAVDSSQIEPTPARVAPLYGSTYSGSILLSPSTTSIPIAGALVGSGVTPIN